MMTDFVAGEQKQLGRYTVIAYTGNHATCAGTVHFLISDGNRALFYGLDGAWLLYEEAQAIIAAKPDLAVLDSTVGQVAACDDFKHQSKYYRRLSWLRGPILAALS